MKLLTRLLPLTAFAPMLAFAQSINTNFLTNSLQAISNFINLLIPFIMALALLFFIWGVFKYFVLGGGDEEKQSEGKKFMVYSIMGLVLMLAVWGIVQIVINLLGIGGVTTAPQPLPKVN